LLNEISEMKQRATLALGILGLKTVFVQSEWDNEFCKLFINLPFKFDWSS